MVNIYLMDDQAFIEIGEKYMLCIGSKDDVDKATPERLMRMIWEAIMWSRYKSITNGRGFVLH